MGRPQDPPAHRAVRALATQRLGAQEGGAAITLARIPAILAPGVLLLALGGALVLLRFPPEAIAIGTCAATLLLAVALWALVDLQRFVLIAVLGAMIFPAAILQPGGAQVAAADVLLVVALGAWLVLLSVRAAPAPYTAGNRLLAPTLLFAAATLASLTWSVSLTDTVKATLQTIEIAVVLPLVFASLPRSLGVIRRGLMVYIGLTCALAVVTLVLFAPRFAAGDLTAQYLPGLHKNAIGAVLAAGLVLAYGFWLAERRPRVRGALVLAALVELGGLIATISRGSLLGAFVAVIVVSMLLRRRRLLTLALAAVAATVFLLTFGTEGTGDEPLEPGGYPSSEVREYSFGNAVEKIAERPLLGTGAGTYWDHIPQLDIGLADPNNMFLLTWAELGIMGLAALLFLLYRFGRLLIASRRLPDAAAVPAVAAGGVSLSLLMHFQVDATWTRGTTSLAFAMMGLMLAAGRLAPNRHDPPPGPTVGGPAVTTGDGGTRPAAAFHGRGRVPGRGGEVSAADGLRVTGERALLDSQRTPEAPRGRGPRRLAAAGSSGAASPAAESPGRVTAAVADDSTPLRVLHVVTSNAFAGIERHVVRLARELRALGCAAELACPPSAARLRAEAASAGIPAHPSASVRRGAWLGAVARRLAAEPPDVVHLHDGRAAVAGSLLTSLGRPLLVRTQHFTHPASVERSGWRRDASLALHRTLNRRLDGYVAVSRSVAEAALRRYETGNAEVTVIPPGIDPLGEEGIAGAQAARERLTHPVVACVGRLEAEKRLDVLLHAVPRVLERLPACRFVVAGSGGVQEELHLLARGLGIEAAVTWTGEVANPAPVLERAHVYVNPSPAEGFGLATAEAMALALPAVAVASGGSAEIVEDGVTGLLVAAADAAALAEAIVRLAGDRPRAARMGAEARRRTASRYGIDQTAQATLAFYGRLREGVRS